MWNKYNILYRCVFCVCMCVGVHVWCTYIACTRNPQNVTSFNSLKTNIHAPDTLSIACQLVCMCKWQKSECQTRPSMPLTVLYPLGSTESHKSRECPWLVYQQNYTSPAACPKLRFCTLRFCTPHTSHYMTCCKTTTKSFCWQIGMFRQGCLWHSRAAWGPKSEQEDMSDDHLLQNPLSTMTGHCMSPEHTWKNVQESLN